MDQEDWVTVKKGRGRKANNKTTNGHTSETVHQTQIPTSIANGHPTGGKKWVFSPKLHHAPITLELENGVLSPPSLYKQSLQCISENYGPDTLKIAFNTLPAHFIAILWENIFKAQLPPDLLNNMQDKPFEDEWPTYATLGLQISSLFNGCTLESNVYKGNFKNKQDYLAERMCTMITNQIVKQMFTYPYMTIKDLNLSNSNVSDSSLIHLNFLKDTLCKLNLRNTYVSDESVFILSKFAKLDFLDIGRTKVTGFVFTRWLEASKKEVLEDEAGKRLLLETKLANPNLKSKDRNILKKKFDKSIKDRKFRKYMELKPKEFFFDYAVSNGALNQFFPQPMFGRVTKLGLSVAQITSTIIDKISNNCNLLKEIEVYGDKLISILPEALIALKKLENKIKSLSLINVYLTPPASGDINRNASFETSSLRLPKQPRGYNSNKPSRSTWLHAQDNTEILNISNTMHQLAFILPSKLERLNIDCGVYMKSKDRNGVFFVEDYSPLGVLKSLKHITLYDVNENVVQHMQTTVTNLVSLSIIRPFGQWKGHTFKNLEYLSFCSRNPSNKEKPKCMFTDLLAEDDPNSQIVLPAGLQQLNKPNLQSIHFGPCLKSDLLSLSIQENFPDVKEEKWCDFCSEPMNVAKQGCFWHVRQQEIEELHDLPFEENRRTGEKSHQRDEIMKDRRRILDKKRKEEKKKFRKH